MEENTRIDTIKAETDVSVHSQENIIAMETDGVCILQETEPEVDIDTVTVENVEERDPLQIKTEEDYIQSVRTIKTEDEDCVGFVEGETGYCSETCATGGVGGIGEGSVDGEWAIDIKEEVCIKVEETIDIKDEIPEAIKFPQIDNLQEYRMDFTETACVCALLLRIRKNRRKKRHWVHPLVSKRLLNGQFYKLYEDLRNCRGKFFKYFRMSVESFDKLLVLVGPLITYENTRLRLSVPPQERLAVTLRYLATGNSFISLHYEYLLGATTVREIVRDTCDAIWECLKPVYMSARDKNDWIRTADEFYERTNFPNCIGAVDGKHIRVRKPNESGSQFFNHKKFFSTVLMAVADADYCFISVEVGACGSSSDSNVFRNSTFGKLLYSNKLNIPDPRVLPSDAEGLSMPFVLVGDEAVALSEHVLRPYPNRTLTCVKRIYNYRLSRARRIVECTFGILANKWRIFYRPIDVKPDFCDNIIKACCVLHNYVRKNDGIQFDDTLYECPLESVQPVGTRGSITGIAVRDYFAKYFTLPQGSVPWQYDKM